MDIVILIGSFTVVCLMGMPVAYALGIASILGALYTGIPLEAVMLKVSGGMSGFSLLAIPFFILAGAIMAVGGMAERLVNLAKVFVGFIRGGMALVNIDRKSTRLNSSHMSISYAVFCLKKKK